jgi:hypothetical protein
MNDQKAMLLLLLFTKVATSSLHIFMHDVNQIPNWPNWKWKPSASRWWLTKVSLFTHDFYEQSNINTRCPKRKQRSITKKDPVSLCN